MFDIDPALIEAPYYEEIVVDGNVQAVAPLLVSYEKLAQEQTTSVEKPQLLLYSRSTCPYCKKVLKYLKKNHKSIPIKDIGIDLWFFLRYLSTSRKTTNRSL